MRRGSRCATGPSQAELLAAANRKLQAVGVPPETAVSGNNKGRTKQPTIAEILASKASPAISLASTSTGDQRTEVDEKSLFGDSYVDDGLDGIPLGQPSPAASIASSQTQVARKWTVSCRSSLSLWYPPWFLRIDLVFRTCPKFHGAG